MEKFNFTFLTEGQIWGDKDGNGQLDALKAYGRQAAATDAAAILGAFVRNQRRTLKGDENCAWWWSASPGGDTNVHCVYADGLEHWRLSSERSGAARPASSFSSISNLPNVVRGADGILRCRMGSYPQTIVSEGVARKLNNPFSKKKKTGRVFTFDMHYYDEYSNSFTPRTVEEYEYNGKRYVQLECLCRSGELLSNGQETELGEIYWVEVEPIDWIIDEKSKMIISERCLYAGIQFDTKIKYYGDFSKTFAKKYLDEYFANEIAMDASFVSTIDNTSKNSREAVKRRKNPYNFDFDENISPEQELANAIKANEPVFLHGLPGDGKSARVKQIDPECVTLLLASCSLDRLNGKTVFNQTTGKVEDVPPAWYDELKAKCEAEPDKNHILFLDELTNALPSIQSEALTLVLDRKVNGRFELPKNCRIVAAGNEVEDSDAAWDMIQPLYTRFGHVYIKTTKENWLPWAAKAGIHPAVYAYIAYNGDEVLRTPFDGEQPNANPRSWEKVSNELYAGGNPYQARKHIGFLADDFAAFCRKEVVTLNDVLQGNFDENDYAVELDEKFLTVTGLTAVDEKNVEKVRNFVKGYGQEMCALFDSLWCHGDESRLERIAELRLSSQPKEASR